MQRSFMNAREISQSEVKYGIWIADESGASLNQFVMLR